MSAFTTVTPSELLVAALILLGALFVLLGAIGLVRLPDTLMRLHAPTKASTLGVGALLLASAVHFSTIEAGISLHEAAIVLFLFITAPVTAQLLAKAALHRNLTLVERTQGLAIDDTGADMAADGLSHGVEEKQARQAKTESLG